MFWIKNHPRSLSRKTTKNFWETGLTFLNGHRKSFFFTLLILQTWYSYHTRTFSFDCIRRWDLMTWHRCHRRRCHRNRRLVFCSRWWVSFRFDQERDQCLLFAIKFTAYANASYYSSISWRKRWHSSSSVPPQIVVTPIRYMLYPRLDTIFWRYNTTFPLRTYTVSSICK